MYSNPQTHIMKKIMTLCISGFIALGFSMSLNAQSSEQDLDQVELMKQLIGTWEVESGVDLDKSKEIRKRVK